MVLERVLRGVWLLCYGLFIVSSVYSLAAYLIAPLALLGMFLAFGFILNAAVVPSGLAVFLSAGIHRLVKHGKEGLATSVVLLAIGLVPMAYFAHKTWSERARIVDRAQYIAALPVERVDVGSDTTLLLFEDERDARCGGICFSALKHGSVASVVVAYRPGWRGGDIVEDSQYREFKLGQGGACSDADIQAMSGGTWNEWAPLYRLARLCIVSHDLDAPPDGLWVFQDRNVRDHPSFKFEGRLVEIYLRRAGERRLLVHYEAGSGHYQFFPPMFATGFISSPPSMKTVWASGSYSYGERAELPESESDQWWRQEPPIATAHLIERVADISFSDNQFPESVVPTAMKVIGEMEKDYSNIDYDQKTNLLRAVRQLLIAKPRLFVKLKPLVLRAAEDGGPITAVAVDILSNPHVTDVKPYWPIISRGLDDPVVVGSTIKAFLALDISVSEHDLLRLTKTLLTRESLSRQADPAAFRAGRILNRDFFELLDRQESPPIVVFTAMLEGADYDLVRAAATRLIQLGDLEKVRARANVFANRLRTYEAQPGDDAETSHLILAQIGLKDVARLIMERKRGDPSTAAYTRVQLWRMLDELEAFEVGASASGSQ